MSVAVTVVIAVVLLLATSVAVRAWRRRHDETSTRLDILRAVLRAAAHREKRNVC